MSDAPRDPAKAFFRDLLRVEEDRADKTIDTTPRGVRPEAEAHCYAHLDRERKLTTLNLIAECPIDERRNDGQCSSGTLPG
jgi:hypothetical protein